MLFPPRWGLRVAGRRRDCVDVVGLGPRGQEVLLRREVGRPQAAGLRGCGQHQSGRDAVVPVNATGSRQGGAKPRLLKQ